ncbi:hypothetical protein [uncultured Dokdonia sp.]|uniref:hypothetical protein n=1 Tax=uncultured Dokdonia sp. TaxID=575653 RepID=UPI00262F4EF8|nr:hypothetical protein [uncultured Dokdonia sp.]
MDTIKTDRPKKTNYKKWAFILCIICILLWIASTAVLLSISTTIEIEILVLMLNIFGTISNISLITGMILTILSISNKEKKNYQYYTSIIVFPILILQTALVYIQTYIG